MHSWVAPNKQESFQWTHAHNRIKGPSSVCRGTHMILFQSSSVFQFVTQMFLYCELYNHTMLLRTSKGSIDACLVPRLQLMAWMCSATTGFVGDMLT